MNPIFVVQVDIDNVLDITRTEKAFKENGLLTRTSYVDHLSKSITWEYVTERAAKERVLAIKDYLRTKPWRQRKNFTVSLVEEN